MGPGREKVYGCPRPHDAPSVSGLPRWRSRAFAVAVWASLILATAIQAVADQPSMLAEINIGAPPGAAVRHVFGGRAISLSATVYGTSDVRVDLKAQLVQLSSGLVAPAGESVEVATGVDFRRDLRRRLTFDVTVPAVERQARFEVVLFGRVVPAGDWRRLGSASFRAYPNDLLEPLKRWSEDRPFRLHDPSGSWSAS